MPSHDRIPVQVLNQRPEIPWQLPLTLAAQVLLKGITLELTGADQAHGMRS